MFDWSIGLFACYFALIVNEEKNLASEQAVVHRKTVTLPTLRLN